MSDIEIIRNTYEEYHSKKREEEEKKWNETYGKLFNNEIKNCIEKVKENASKGINKTTCSFLTDYYEKAVTHIHRNMNIHVEGYYDLYNQKSLFDYFRSQPLRKNATINIDLNGYWGK